MDHISKLQSEIAELRTALQTKEHLLNELKQKIQTTNNVMPLHDDSLKCDETSANIGDKLQKWAIERYSRQILLSDIGAEGQGKICSSKVLIVGAGGLGCPAAAYLAGSGVGTIGIVDYDTVDLTNIHRQILHGEEDQDKSKVESAAQAMRRINSRIKVVPYNVQLDSKNATEIVSEYDVVLDCTDNVPTRYMLNDVCVMAKKPLISGSALKMEGQLTIYGYISSNGTKKGPCYRCVFPAPPPPHAVGSCSADGVAAPIPAVIGSLQALETIKYIVGNDDTKLLVGRMLLFDGEDTSFRTVKLRPKSAQCAVCSDHPAITVLLDYETACQAKVIEKGLELDILSREDRISPTDLAELLKVNYNQEERHLLIDVRSEAEFKMCNIDGAVNCPIDKLRDKRLEDLLEEIKAKYSDVTFICRQGNDSQIAAQRVMDAMSNKQTVKIRDLCGGLHAWSRHIDSEFPIY